MKRRLLFSISALLVLMASSAAILAQESIDKNFSPKRINKCIELLAGRAAGLLCRDLRRL